MKTTVCGMYAPNGIGQNCSLIFNSYKNFGIVKLKLSLLYLYFHLIYFISYTENILTTSLPCFVFVNLHHRTSLVCCKGIFLVICVKIVMFLYIYAKYK